MCENDAEGGAASEHRLVRSECGVLSDVHIGCSSEATSVVSVFTITRKTRDVAVDPDTGDLDPPRKRLRQEGVAAGSEDLQLRIRHAVVTPLESVGLQVWRGALLLADYILSGACAASVRGRVVLELGSGTGLASALLARAGARCVLATDVGDDVLELCRRNIEEAAGPCGYAAGTVRVAELDWSAPLPAAPGGGSAAAAADAKQTEQGQQQKQQQQQQREGPPGGDGGAFGWTAETAELLRDVTAVFAADLIYDDDLTDAFMDCARRVFEGAPGCEAMFVATEKRINFSPEDLTARAHAYDHWRDLFEEETGREGAAAVAARDAHCVDKAECGAGALSSHRGPRGDCHPDNDQRRPFFVGRRIDVGGIPQSIFWGFRGKRRDKTCPRCRRRAARIFHPQMIFPCDRVSQLELWRLRPLMRQHQEPTATSKNVMNAAMKQQQSAGS